MAGVGGEEEEERVAASGAGPPSSICRVNDVGSSLASR